MFDRPPQTSQPRRREMLVPCPTLFECLVLATGTAKALESCEFADQIVGEPSADLRPELLDVLHAL
jgi:hypothetical protein